jgi:large subunit ribosomal protein L17
MRHNKVTRNLGVKTGHRTAMLRNLARGLVRDGSIRTTSARAKTLRSFIEPLVTKLKDPTVANIRYVASCLNDRPAVQSLIDDIAPKFKTREGGYTRILKLANRRPGDCADMAVIQWVDDELVEKGFESRFPKAAAKGTKKGAKKAGKKTTKEDASEESTEEKAPKKAKPAKASKKSA